ncbi:hypothetical protein EAY64_00170 [Aquitalea palustris]|uniref:Uncharacterized protein n=1 Tax=Aquitalea palustris TaxID=2480983 RepID=A0A454JP65_9NEIS|nr:hypothetical protein EAY64_00170 [Aquitalea palustris]
MRSGRQAQPRPRRQPACSYNYKGCRRGCRRRRTAAAHQPGICQQPHSPCLLPRPHRQPAHAWRRTARHSRPWPAR